MSLPDRTRSTVTNARRFHRDKIDTRTAAGRRFRDLVKSLSAEAGVDYASLPETGRAMIRLAASLMITAENVQQEIACGKRVNPDILVRLSSEARRALEAVQRRKNADAGTGFDLRTYLSQSVANGGAR